MSNEKNNYSNDSDERQELIKTFLYDVERKLPFWLKDEKDNIKDILEELETHIWDRATELAEGGEPSEEQIELVIDQMGSPSKIAGEYKRRGKPKYFITEELFPIYTKILIIVGAVLVGFNFIGLLFSFIGTTTAREVFGDFFQGIFISIAITLVLITIQFVYLSKEGYLPEDFSRFTSRLPSTIRRFFETRPKETTEATDAKSEAAAKTFQESTPTETTVTIAAPKIVKETIIVKEPRVIREKITPGPERVVKYKRDLGRNYLSEGITGMVFGTALVVMPFLPLFDFMGTSPLRYWLVILGGISLVIGIIRFLQALVGRLLRLQQGLMFLSIFPKAVYIPLWLSLIRTVFEYDGIHQEVLSKINWLVTNVDWYWWDQSTTFLVLQIIVYVIIGINALSIISELSRIAKLETEGFPMREVEIYR
ncbi:MAG: hypothetical protein GPJ52_09060 [Candidatus Heimdallarchaeota archaeon]|nr:hypothetical protein [Candidatus Heimdallarchaeota archaeon]MCG3253706.1 hypothetical protein [Candidatus Heimdallarchaeota archaeon]MCK4290842.1 hypothetical protein [Candidatus Heimdallarchaeota archaeon]